MNDTNQKQLGKTLWNIADRRDGRRCSLQELRYLSDNYETAAKKELGRDYPAAEGREPSGSAEFPPNSPDGSRRAAKANADGSRRAAKANADDRRVPLALWYANHPDDVPEFEKQVAANRSGPLYD